MTGNPATTSAAARLTSPNVTADDLRRVLSLTTGSPIHHAAVPEGRFNRCWHVDTGTRQYLLKINTDQGIRHLRRLARNTRRAAASGVAVPTVEKVGVDERIGPYLVQHWLEGRTLAELVDTFGRPALDPQIWHNLGVQIGRLHLTSLPGRRPITVLGQRTRRRELESMIRDGQRKGAIPGALAADIVSRGRLLLDRMSDQEAVLSHLDLHPGNILITDARRATLLDFDHARAADPIYDFVKIQMWCAPDPGLFDLVRDGYRETRDLQDDDSFWASLAFYRLVNHVSYCLYWSARDPRQIGEWISALHEELAKP